MKVVHLSHHDIQGGAAKAAYRLHSAMLRSGVDSTMCVSVKHSDDFTVTEIKRKPPLFPRNLRHYARAALIRAAFSRYRSNLLPGFEIFSDDRSPYGARLPDRLPSADVINLHWVAGFLDFGLALPDITRLAPVVWRLSDMNPFTGGCHYNQDCRQFEKQCGSCPQLGSKDPGDLSHCMWVRKNRAVAKIDTRRMRIIALNRWMETEILESSLFKDIEITVIPNGIDLERFTPMDRDSSRKALGIPLDARVVLFVAESVSNPRKGLAGLIKVLNDMADQTGLLLLTFGSFSGESQINIPHRHLGYLDDPLSLSRAYSSADVYVHPATQDNQPNTVLEAMACKLPVVALDSGGVPELVSNGETGLIVPCNDLPALSQGIRTVLQDKNRSALMGSLARARAEKCFSRQVQVNRYLTIYREMIARNRS